MLDQGYARLSWADGWRSHKRRLPNYFLLKYQGLCPPLKQEERMASCHSQAEQSTSPLQARNRCPLAPPPSGAVGSSATPARLPDSPFVGGSPTNHQAGGATSPVGSSLTAPMPVVPAPAMPMPRTSNDSSTLKPPPEVGGRVASFSPQWESIETSEAVLSLVLGVRLEFSATPPPTPPFYACF